MKRCPECDFLYLDSDQLCDLDGTPLAIDEASAETSAKEKEPQFIRQVWKTFAMLIIPGVVFGAILFLVYNRVAIQRKTLASNNAPNSKISHQPSPRPEPSPAESATPIIEPSKSPVPKASPAKTVSPTAAQLSSKPVSTGSEEKTKRSMIIRLSDGGTIAADEAWRTKDGIWYRRNGVVTLLKRHQVKAMEKAP